MRRRSGFLHAPATTIVLALFVGCSSGSSEDEPDLPVTPAPGFVATCTDAGVVPPPAASVVTACGTPSGINLPVDLLLTDTPAGEAIVAASFEIDFNPAVAQFVVGSCFAGPALGAPSELDVNCSVDSSFPNRLVVSVRRRGPVPGVVVTGTQLAATVTFRVGAVGLSALSFLAPNDPNGSALLKNVAGVPTLIPGISFAAATTLEGS